MVTGSGRIAAMLVIGGSFAILTILVWIGETNSLDVALRNWALSSNTPISVAIWEDMSLIGSVAVLSGLTFVSLGIFIIRHDWWAARRLALAMSGAVALDTSIKWIVQRPRPDEIYASTMPTSFSFPSGHALYSFVFYFTIAIILSRGLSGYWRQAAWYSTIVIVALIGASRIFLGVHYGSDVIAGYLVAAVWTIFLSISNTVKAP